MQVSWTEPDFGAKLVEAQPEGWNVHTEPRPFGFPVEHPWLDRWNASIRSIILEVERPGEDQDETEDDHDHAPRRLRVHLDAPARLNAYVLADEDPQVARNAVLRLLEALTDGNESQREAWTEALLAEPDLGSMEPPTREQRASTPLPHRLDLPPERLRMQPFVDENLVTDGTAASLRGEEWSLDYRFARTTAARGGQEFEAMPGENGYRDDRWREEYPSQRAVEDFRTAYAALGVGPAPAPEDVHVSSMVC